MDPILDTFQGLAIALAIGLLIGMERGWQTRLTPEGSEFAGIRTFGLIGLLGGLWGVLAQQFGMLLLGFGFVGLTILVIAAHVSSLRSSRDYGATTIVAALVTFSLGAMAVLGYKTVAAASAVIVTTLLGLKPVLHRWLERLEREELFAVLKLLLISVVLLPVLPDRGYGPWLALNPFVLWWMVVLIAGVSSVGYFAIKAAGPAAGTLLTALAGGLTSSTAVALSFARLAQRTPAMQTLLSAGILLASATMFPRILVEVAVVNHRLLWVLAWPLLVMMALMAIAGLWLWRRQRSMTLTEVPLSNPFELGMALKFGLLLTVLMLLSAAARQWLGAKGIYALAAASGLADVDAITLSLARLASSGVNDGLDLGVAARGIVIAATVNTLVKAAMVAFIVRGAMAVRVAVVCVLAAVVAMAWLWW